QYKITAVQSNQCRSGESTIYLTLLINDYTINFVKCSTSNAENFLWTCSSLNIHTAFSKGHLTRASHSISANSFDKFNISKELFIFVYMSFASSFNLWSI